MDEGIAIIGIGCIYPKADNKDIFWNNIIRKVSAISEVKKEKWDSDLYYHPDKSMPDKTYSKIGGFVNPIDEKAMALKFKIPPKTFDSMDMAQTYAIAATGQALEDSGYDKKAFDRERTAVIIGNSMGGDQIDYSNLRIFFGDIENYLGKTKHFSSLDPAMRESIMKEFESSFKGDLPIITEDSLPGELANVISGRIANVFNLNGPNFSVDAACASSLAALSESMKGLRSREFDMVITGGSDYMMGPGPYVKFCKIGALSPDGSRPFDARANGFVMGEGTGLYILKRVSDARRDGDKIYAVIRGVGASSDGKGKGITAPNPKGQVIAVTRCLQAAGFAPETVQCIEAHGTATTVGDATEMGSMNTIWNDPSLKTGSIGVTSVKSMIGHLKAAAGSASIIKTALALHNKVMGPSLNYEEPNPNVGFGRIPFRVITEPEEWPRGINGNPRRAGISAFGFGGTNYHVAVEEDTGFNGMPDEKKVYSPGVDLERRVASDGYAAAAGFTVHPLSESVKAQLEGEAVIIGGDSWEDVKKYADEIAGMIDKSKSNGRYGVRLHEIAAAWNVKSRGKDFRLGISAESLDDLKEKIALAKEAVADEKKWLFLGNKGIFFGANLNRKRGELGRMAFMFPGQGTQYINMLKELYHKFQVVRDTFDMGDRIMLDILGERISGLIFIDENASEQEKKAAEKRLRQTEVTQPAILICDYALFRLVRSFGIAADIVVGHSLGEYGALIAAQVMDFNDALHAVAARGKEIANVQIDDVGKMASISADFATVEEVLKRVDGYVIAANKNCYSQTVISGKSHAVMKAVEEFTKLGIQAVEIPVSHAFHSEIVAPACGAYRRVLEKININEPKIDIIGNIDAQYYPKGPGAPKIILDKLVDHIANPVEFVSQIERMYQDGVRMFMELGPKKALTTYVQNVTDKKPVYAFATNHPKRGGVFALNDALASLAAWGYEINWTGIAEDGRAMEGLTWRFTPEFLGKKREVDSGAPLRVHSPAAAITLEKSGENRYAVPGRSGVLSGSAPDSVLRGFQEGQERIMKDILDEYSRRNAELMKGLLSDALVYKREMELLNINLDRMVISGVSMGLPGMHHRVFDDGNFDRLARGENMIDYIPDETFGKIIEKNIFRLVKTTAGDASFQIVRDRSEVIKLAGIKGQFDFESDYGFKEENTAGLDISTKLAIAAGIEALRDAGIPLVMNYKSTTTHSVLPTHWGLSDSLSDETGIIFASAFPGTEPLIDEISRGLAFKYGAKAKKELIDLYSSLISRVEDDKTRAEITDWYTRNYSMITDEGKEESIYKFNRLFLFRILAMGHSQFAEMIKAKGPNIQLNSACASTVVAVATAEDWIRTGRAKRVIVVAADDVTNNRTLDWFLSAFLALGAATTRDTVQEAAIPFDRRRNGMIVGMGAVGIIIEAESEVKKRGMEPIAELVATEFCNSAFHGSRLDIEHISSVMEKLITKAEARMGIKRDAFARETLFMSHETYTPARGGSASAEIYSLRNAFGKHYPEVMVANTKGFTGHAMAAGIEDAVVVRAIQTGKVPPIANFSEPDPELGDINLSKGGYFPGLKYGLRLGAGFGSQIAMSFIKLVSRDEKRITDQALYTRWLSAISGLSGAELEVVNRTLRVRADNTQFMKTAAQKKVEIKKPAAAPVIPAAAPREVRKETKPSGTDMIRKKISEIVSEKTGYPKDLIEFDLDMESDLGIDTVKQAELFGTVRDIFNISRDEDLQIKEFPTLNHVVQFVIDRSPDFKGMIMEETTTAEAAPAVSAVKAPAAGTGVGLIRQRVMKIVSEKTGYPEDLIDFDLDMESDLGIDTVKQAELFGTVRDLFNISRDEDLQIKEFPTLNHVVQFVIDRSPDFAGMSMEEAAPAQTLSASVQSAAPSSGGGIDVIRRRIMKVVSEKTGYPEDLIDFSLDMESDLGIDTVKQAELFGTVRDLFNISRDEDLQIKEFPTLNHVVQFVIDRSPDFRGLAMEDSAPVQTLTASAQSAAPAAGGGTDVIRRRIVKIVSEKTGYPEDLIDFNLDMESDLGIDTVKQAELFGTVRDLFNISRDEDLQIKEFPTLNHVVQFVIDRSPDFKGMAMDEAAVVQSAVHSAAQAVSSDGTGTDTIRRRIAQVVADKTGYPEDLIDFSLDMESDLGIDTVKQAELFGTVRDLFNISRDEDLQIKEFPTLNHVVQFVIDRSPDFRGLAAAQASAPATVPAAKISAAPAASDGKMDEVKKKMAAIVAEKTGYPEDLIDFDLDMESDLGIDTVKQAELFGTVRELFDIPREEDIQIKDFPTLNHVLKFVKDRSPHFAGLSVAGVVPATGKAREIGEDAHSPASAIKRMTVEMTESPLDKGGKPSLELKGLRVLVTDDGLGVAKALGEILEKNGAQGLLVSLDKAGDEKEVTGLLEGIRKDGQVNGIIHLAGLGETKGIDEMTFDDWRGATFRRIKSLFIIAKALQGDIEESGRSGRGFIVSATPMGGSFGFGDFTAKDPLGGGVAGITKSISKEMEGIIVKVIDLSLKEKPAALAKTIVDEILYGGKAVEAGYSGKKRALPRIIYRDVDSSLDPEVRIDKGSVFLITGGGYGITSEVAKDIAKKFSPTIAIVSRTGIPSDAADLARLDEKGLKALKDKVVAGLKAKHDRVTPVMIDREFGKYTTAIEKYRNVQEMIALGARAVEYFPCDVANNGEMAKTIGEITKKFGKIDVIIHGAGLEESKLMKDKKYDDFCRIFDIKADGAYNLAELTRDQEVKALVIFGSISGRFGNNGQTDYAAANDLLNKYARLTSRRSKGRTRGVAMNWAGWEDVGMATRGSIKKIFQEAGIDMIPLAEGVERVSDELLHGRDSEVIIAGRVGPIDSEGTIAGYRSSEFTAASDKLAAERDKYPMLDTLVRYQAGVVLEARKKLDPHADLYLGDHAIDGVPYFPAVMGIESFAEAAELLCPGMHVAMMRDVRFMIPVKILKNKPADIIITVEKNRFRKREHSALGPHRDGVLQQGRR